jgi:DNA-binding LytR/AlgR family response regulator
MKVLIIEDETPAAEKLERYLKRLEESIEILSILQSVKESVAWFESNPDLADLVFMDIQLTDGKSFDIFEKTKVKAPIIFTTAYDEYAIEAFKVNGIAYLLKPITFEDIEEAFDKVHSLKSKLSEDNKESSDDLNQILSKLGGQTQVYKNRFMVKIGDHIRSIPTPDIRIFFAEGRDAYLITQEGRKYIIDYKLEQLETILDPVDFMRVNRSFILKIDSIKDVIVYSNSRLKVLTEQEVDREIIISREKVPQFKAWIDGAGA